MIRRLLNKKPISSADKMHLHHRLISLGFTHRGAVLMIYCMSLIFSLISFLYLFTNTWGTIFLTIASILGLQLFIELIELSGENRQPLLHALKFVGNKAYRQKKLLERKKKKE